MIIKNWPHSARQRTKRVGHCDATLCDMLETNGMSDTHYSAHVRISKGSRCKWSQKKTIIEEWNAAYSATTPALALIARLCLFFLRQCAPRCVMEHNAIALPLTPRSDNFMATLQQLCDDCIE